VKFTDISNEFHPSRNNGLKADQIPYSSHKKIWWKCDKGFDHVWKASPNTRTSMNTGCPICSGYKVVKSNSLAFLFPELALQWNYKKNSPLSPDSIYARSSRKIWWKCPEGDDHVWKSTLKSRANGVGCPICSGRKTTKSNSLGVKYPEIAKFWNTNKNREFSIYNVTPYSSIKVWWKCHEGDDHEWESTVANMVNGSTCPVCMGRKITKNNNLKKLFPKLIEEWNFEKNTIDPQKISPGSKEKVWWICSCNKEHNWFSTIKDRTGKESGCPFCSIKLNVSETKMLGLIKDIFQNREILYRYKPKWLKRMELDVYVPSIKLGFEYQGMQHFKPIEFFGGEETFIEQVKRDKLKKELCEKHSVKLIEVYYDEILSHELIKEKVIDIGILST